MKTIKAKHFSGSGSYGYYFRTSKLWGAKVVYCRGCADGTDDPKDLPHQCGECKRAVAKEARLVALAHKGQAVLGVCIPKTKGVVRLSVGRKGLLAVSMQHIVGDEPSCSLMDDEHGSEHWNEIEDAHSGNFIVEEGTGNLYRIDLGLWRPSGTFRRRLRRRLDRMRRAVV